MNAQPISISTIKKWEAIACDPQNHALVVYKRDDGFFVVDVFEVLELSENEQGSLCLRAVSLSAKYNGPDMLCSDSIASFDAVSDDVVEIPIGAIVESQRYRHGTGLNDLDIRRYYESIANVRSRQDHLSMSRTAVGLDRMPDIAKSFDTRSGEILSPWFGCMMWLVYASALFAFALWVF